MNRSDLVTIEGYSEAEEAALRSSAEKSRLLDPEGTYFRKGPDGFEDFQVSYRLGRLNWAVRGTREAHDESLELNFNVFLKPRVDPPKQCTYPGVA